MDIKSIPIIQSIFLIMFFLLSITIFSQKLVKTNGSYEVRIEKYMTETEAKEQAKEQAMIKAIENVFGMYVEQRFDMEIVSGRVHYNIIGTTRVKGDWIETLEEKCVRRNQTIPTNTGDEDISYMYCNVKGKVRKATPKAFIHYQTLNYPTIESRCTDFYSGEQLYLFFKSPVDGYLSVFLDDGTTVFRLFPYENILGEKANAGKIIADKNYFLFSKQKEHQYFDNEFDEVELYTTQNRENNKLYIVFSEKPYLKPVLSEVTDFSEYKTDYKKPKSLSQKKFQEWLVYNRSLDDRFIDAKVKITIISK